MAGYAIGRFISGMVEGGEIRHRWQDRKRSQKIEDENRAIAKEDRARRIAREAEEAVAWREDRDYLRGERDYARGERARLAAGREEQERVFSDAEKAATESANQSLADALEAQAGAAPAPVAPPETAPAPAGGFRMRPPGGAAPGAIAPSEAPPPVVVPSPESSLTPPPVPGGRAAPEGLVAGGKTGAADAAEPAPPPARRMRPPAPPEEVVSEPTVSPMAGESGEVNEPPFVRGREGRRMRPPQPDDAPATPPRAEMPEVQPRGVRPATNPGPIISPATPPAPDAAPAAPQAASPAAAAPGAAAAAAAPAPRAPVPSAAPDSPVPPVTPSVEVAVGAARTVRPTSPAKIQTFDEAFIKAYREEQVPKIARYYLSKGDVATADAFQKWASDGATQEGMRSWGRAVASATIGDEDGFLDNLVDAYNSTGYFDDGMSVIRDKSGFVRDDEGNPTGAFITFRDDETGEEGTQRFDDVSDLYQLGINFLSPEAVFEQGMEMVKAADEAAAKAMEHERDIEIEKIKAEGKQKTTAELLSEEIEELRSNDMTGEFSSLPVEEQVAKAVESLRAQQAALAAGAGPAAVVAAMGE